MKVKIKKHIPMWDSYKGLPFDVWEKLNSGKEVELKEIPELAKPFLTIKSAKKPKEK